MENLNYFQSFRLKCQEMQKSQLTFKHNHTRTHTAMSVERVLVLRNASGQMSHTQEPWIQT